MGAAVFLWALALLSCMTLASSDPHYLVVVPAVINHPNTEKLCILLHSLPETVHLEVKLETEAENHTLVQKDVEKPGIYECISFQVPDFAPSENILSENEEIAHVHVFIQKGDSVSFEGRKKVLMRYAHPKVFIKPSKPFYKPGETAKFRIVRLNGEFKAVGERIPEILLEDPYGNRIGQWVDMKPHHGILDLSFPLASEAALGTYTIKLEGISFDKKKETEKTFTVEEYELHNFEVLFEIPSLVTTSDKEFQVKVCGKYTYGKPVQGNVHLHLTRDISYIFEEVLDETLSIIEKEYTGQADKTGCATFTINGADIKLVQKGYAKYISLTAEMEEKGTGVMEEKSIDIPIAVKEVTVKFGTLNPFYKQGFPYTGKMTVSVLGLPVQNWTVYLTVDVDDVKTNIPYVTDENGEVQFSLDTTNWKNTLVSLWGRYYLEDVTGLEGKWRMIESEDLMWLKPFYSDSNSFLEIQHIEEELPCGEDQEVLVDYILDRKELDAEADHLDVYYLILSKGRIVSSGQKRVPVGKDETLKGTFSLTLSASSDLAPFAWLLLYAVFADGEVAADIDVFTIENCFKHKVTLDFSEKEQLPGSKVNLQLEAAPGALCSVQAIDKSVTLKKDDSLTAEKIYEAFAASDSGIVSARGFSYRLEDFEPYPCLPPHGPSQSQKQSSRAAPWYQNEADVYSLFKTLRMKILTNMEVKKPVSCDLPSAERIPFRGTLKKVFGDSGPENNALVEEGSQAVDSVETKTEEKARTRSEFPETWIWDLVPIDEEGKAVRSVTVPDTITEWNANAFCLASDVGFGLSEEVPLKIFKPFFVEMQLPYSVVRGETFQMKTSVFNYLTECIQVRVNLLESQEVEVMPCPDCQFTHCLCADEAKTFSWNMTATHLGHVKLSVTAEAMASQELCGNKVSVIPKRGQSDTVIKSLLVKPEGILEEKNHNKFLCSSGDPLVESISLELPEAVVKDSARATISAVGDILGISLQHLESLIQLPLGCGEQNMIKFVPNILALQYLEKTNQATPETKDWVKNLMKMGYQRQLLYKHDNGSYSAFGKRDTEGNTWLTAFVAKAFVQAKSYIYIEEKHIQDAIHWLRQHQHPSGCFQSVGRVFNNAVKGGVKDDLSLTAYVTASLLESHLEKNDTMVDDALLCLKRNLSSVDGVYSKALLAYVFALANDMETRQQLLKELQADKIENLIFFFNIEVVAYLLLAHLSAPEVSPDDINVASKLAGALVLLQNAYGGFSSTQDSIVALQALTKYAGLTYREIEELKVLVKSSKDFQHEFHVDKKNRLVLQKVSLPEIPGQYKVEVSGNGCVYVQATLRYNEPALKSDAFALNVTTSSKDCSQNSIKQFDVYLQVSYTGERETSNMVILEVNMLSGFRPMKKSVKKLLGMTQVKNVEIENDKVNIYLDQMDNNVQKYNFSVKQRTEVLDLKAATVKVYDYYHPDDNVVEEYNTPCSRDHQ
uniref:Alpha-2-macroglobulin-like protein 1 isoform X1 n=1 Tax=Pogona vitticeps TaxID=103695 RepID=A0ABM5FQT5_9SAUR